MSFCIIFFSLFVCLVVVVVFFFSVFVMKIIHYVFKNCKKYLWNNILISPLSIQKKIICIVSVPIKSARRQNVAISLITAESYIPDMTYVVLTCALRWWESYLQGQHHGDQVHGGLHEAHRWKGEIGLLGFHLVLFGGFLEECGTMFCWIFG